MPYGGGPGPNVVVAGTVAPMESDGVASLTKLKEMLDKGLITPADFDAKKAEILAKM